MDLQALEDWLVASSAPPSSNSQSQKHAPGPVPTARQVAEVRFDVREPDLGQFNNAVQGCQVTIFGGVWFDVSSGCMCASFVIFANWNFIGRKELWLA